MKYKAYTPTIICTQTFGKSPLDIKGVDVFSQSGLSPDLVNLCYI